MAANLDPKRLRRLEKLNGELIHYAATRKVGADYSQYADNPEGFIRDVLRDDKLWTKSIAMIESVRANRRTSVRGANAMGKDHTAAELALWWVYARHGLVLVTGPTQKQVFEIIFGRELGTLVARAQLPGFLGRWALRPDLATADDGIENMKSGILGLVSTDVSKLTGHHGPLVMCIVTEAQGVSSVAFSSINNNATGPEDRFLVVGNPDHPEGDFYESQRPNSEWVKIVMPASEHPNIVEGRTVIEGGPSRVWMEDARKREKEGSNWWKTYVLAEFPETSSETLFGERDLQGAVKNWKDTTFIERAKSQRLVIAIDVAKGGGDACAMAVLRGPRCQEVIQFETTGVIETEEKIVNNLRALGVRRSGERPANVDPMAWGEEEAVILIDSAPTGGGPGIIAHLQNDYNYDVISFNGSSTQGLPQDEGERYENLRAFAYWALHTSMQLSECAIPDDEMLLQELRAITFKMNKADGIQIERKPEIKKKLKRSPDRADALMMAWSVERETTTIGGSTDYLGF